uniref:Uncharacterized protein n=1 Tax=Pyrodinium bahamense TaxID=73915 RepID=A0A7S0FYN9_9DINO
MTSDLEVPALAGAGGSGPRAGANGSGSWRAQVGERDRLHQMRRHIRQEQERHARTEGRRRAREQELAAQWKEKSDKARADAKEALQDRLAQLEKQRACTRHRAEGAAEAETLARRAPGHAQHGAAAKADGEAGDGRPADVGVEPGPGSVGERNMGSASTAQAPALARAGSGSPRTVLWTAAGAGRRHKGPAAHSATRAGAQLQQELGVPGLVRAMMGAQQSQQSRQDAAVSTKRETHEKPAAGTGSGGTAAGEVEEREASVNELRAAVHRNLARKHRLKMMHMVADQVLQCRQEMAGAFQHSFVVHPADLSGGRMP